MQFDYHLRRKNSNDQYKLTRYIDTSISKTISQLIILKIFFTANKKKLKVELLQFDIIFRSIREFHTEEISVINSVENKVKLSSIVSVIKVPKFVRF